MNAHTDFLLQNSHSHSIQTDRYVTPIPEYRALVSEAEEYLSLFYHEHAAAEMLAQRVGEVEQEIARTAGYTQSYEELAYGARVAWRNSSRCIGRLYWKALTVRDMRHLTTAEEVFEALIEHIRMATNQGKIRSMITVFAPQQAGEEGIRIWNPQLIRYAGYLQENGSVLGDPSHLRLTDFALHYGWKPKKRSEFDMLPLIIQMPNQAPRLFEVPQDAILEVPISHPTYSWFAKMGLKWHALPVISNMRMEIGGLSYTAAPFNGWYMGTEIGARNFADLHRYNLLPIIGEKLGLDMHTDRTLWKDRALVELNIAVLHSFNMHGITIIDHHTASRQFVIHEENEKQLGRAFAADWGWIVPPLSGSVTPVFHHDYQDFTSTPNYFSQPDPLQDLDEYKLHYGSHRFERKAGICPYSAHPPKE
jgi:nitric-oxide synthase, bacterial